MIELPKSVIKELSKQEKTIIPVVEFYPRETEDIVSAEAPAQAFGLFAPSCYTWEPGEHSYTYKAKVTQWPEINLFLGKELNTAEIEFANVERGENSMSRFVLDNKIKGSWMVIRLLYPDSPDDYSIVFWGKCSKPGEIDSSVLTISAAQDLGNYKQEIPFRDYGVKCPLEFAKPGGGCLGYETLEQKSLFYRQAFAEFSTAGCNKLFSTCKLFRNEKFFQGQRIVAVSGQFSYITVEEVVKRVLFWQKRKKIQAVKTDSWSSVNQSEGNETIPLAFGRSQLQGHPFTWADVGAQVKALYGFCEGKISAFDFVRSRTQGISIVSHREHFGDWGGVGTQNLDTLFNGSSGWNSRLAYIEIVTNGSSPTQVDDAPIITAVIRGLEVPVPDVHGNYTLEAWTHNPVHIARFILTEVRFGRIPVSRIDDEANLETAADCEEIVEDRTNEEFIVLPSNELANYGIKYRRYRSTGRYTVKHAALPSRTSLISRNALASYAFDDPEIRWFNPFKTLVTPIPRSVLREKYTFNGALQEKTSLLDFMHERLLPTFKGYILYHPNGKIQIKNRRKADNAYIRDSVRIEDTQIPITNVSPWRFNKSGYLLVGVSLEQAEIREVTGIKFSTACNGLAITADTFGTVDAVTGDITGGNQSHQGEGFIELSGTVTAGSEVVITIGEGENAFYVSYIADGEESLRVFTKMLTAFLNANPQFKQSFTAYTPVENGYRINIACEAGYLVLNKPLEFDHFTAEEIMRVAAVFENCGEITANSSAQFDNIIENTFKWNLDEVDEINALTAKYTSAVDDFHLTKLLPRAGWDTIDLEGELLKDELDLTFVDNYWQAAYLTKGEAIDRIDGNLHFSLETGLLALRLELGEVVAVRHDSGDGALNYVPCWITKNKIDLNDFKVVLGMKLYLSAAFDFDVQPIEPLLTTTLNSSAFPSIPPQTTGRNGGVSRSSIPAIYRPTADYYQQFQYIHGKYSPTGLDLT